MKQYNNITILGIETSCDETGIAILKTSGKQKPNFALLSNIVASQVKIHQRYGGVYPTLARREHEKNLVPVLKKALGEAQMFASKQQTTNNKQLKKGLKTLKEIFERHKILLEQTRKFFAKYEKPKIDIIAVTVGPGLEPCLWTGVNFAKALSIWWDLPIVPVDHLESHILVNFLDPNCQLPIANPSKLFPAIALVVSGGHTQLVLMKDFGKYKIIGETRDDAAGECYDKTARILGLPYPGGPSIAAEAAKLTTNNEQRTINLPRPMLHSKNYDFSFSGLKTAVLYDFKKRDAKTRKSKKYIQEMSYEIQKAINDVLIKKTIKAAKDFHVKTIILAGGVAANEQLRKQLNASCQSLIPNCQFLTPAKNLCTDNAAMIAITAHFHLKCLNFEFKHFKDWGEIKAQANLRLNTRG